MLLRESIELESGTMPGVICVLASEPWGPVRIETAESAHDLLSLGVRPAYFADVGGRDLGQVVAFVKGRLPPADGLGLIKAGLDRATAAVAGAFSAVSAMVVADGGDFASPGAAVSAVAAAVGEAEPDGEFRDAYAPPREVEPAGRPDSLLASRPVAMTTNGDMLAGRPDIVTARRSARSRSAGPEVDVREIRGKLKLSQEAFAKAFGFAVSTVRDWEQGRSQPESAARNLLTVIGFRPNVVKEALGRYGLPVEG